MAANAVGSSRKRAASASRIAAWQLSEVGGVEAVADGVPMSTDDTVKESVCHP